MDTSRLLELLAHVVRDPQDCASSLRAPEVLCTERVVDAALAHEVAGSLSIAIESSGQVVPEVVARTVEHGRLVHLQTTRALGTLAEAFAGSGTPWAVVKGPALARLWEKSSITRSYADLDLLVSRADLAKAAALVQACGFGPRNRNWRGFVDLGVAEIPFDDGAVVVDLHWNVVALTSLRRRVRFDTDQMLARSVVVDLSGVEVPVLDAVDALAHTCSHAGLAGARTLRLLHDAYLCASLVDPAQARIRLSEVGVHRLATGVLARADRLFSQFGQGCESDWRPALGHPVWVGANRVVDGIWLRSPVARHVRLPGALVASGRDGLGATFAAAMGGAAAAIRARLGMPTIESEDGPLDWNRVDPPDSRSGFESYLDYVATGSD
ncbi:MAG: nucleotidyltransferase family protein [Microthrixaceae bacterium]